MQDAHPINTLLDPNVKLTPLPESDTPADIPYAVAIGSLVYVAVGTYSDISFSVQALSQFMTCLSNLH